MPFEVFLSFFLDNFLVQDDIQKIFERVRQKADFMPEWQMNEVMTNEIGPNWRDHFEEFQDRPFAAARLNSFFSF
jgi:aarF domain-containing kinase